MIRRKTGREVSNQDLTPRALDVISMNVGVKIPCFPVQVFPRETGESVDIMWRFDRVRSRETDTGSSEGTPRHLNVVKVRCTAKGREQDDSEGGTASGWRIGEQMNLAGDSVCLSPVHPVRGPVACHGVSSLQHKPGVRSPVRGSNGVHRNLSSFKIFQVSISVGSRSPIALQDGPIFGTPGANSSWPHLLRRRDFMGFRFVVPETEWRGPYLELCGECGEFSSTNSSQQSAARRCKD